MQKQSTTVTLPVTGPGYGRLRQPDPLGCTALASARNGYGVAPYLGYV